MSQLPQITAHFKIDLGKLCRYLANLVLTILPYLPQILTLGLAWTKRGSNLCQELNYLILT